MACEKWEEEHGSWAKPGCRGRTKETWKLIAGPGWARAGVVSKTEERWLCFQV